MVNFIEGCSDEDAPEICVSGVAAIQRISQGMMMITYYKQRGEDIIPVARIIWDREDWLRQWQVWEAHREAISHDAFEVRPKPVKRRDAH